MAGFGEAFITNFLREREGRDVLTSLVLSAAYKLATNETYDLADESRVYDAYLANYNIKTKYDFRRMFMDMMTDKDPTVKNLGLAGTAMPVLTEDGRFTSEHTRSLIASEGRYAAILGPRLVR